MSFGNEDEYFTQEDDELDDGFWGIPEGREPYPDGGCSCGYWQCKGCGGSPD